MSDLEKTFHDLIDRITLHLNNADTYEKQGLLTIANITRNWAYELMQQADDLWAQLEMRQ